MYLAKGIKRWELIDPMHLMALYDPLTQKLWDNRSHPHPDPVYAKILDQIPKYEGTLSNHELLFFPGGWAHRVFTDELSYGCGGSVMKPCDALNSVNIYSLEKALNCDAKQEFNYLEDVLISGFVKMEKDKKNKGDPKEEEKPGQEEKKEEEEKKVDESVVRKTSKNQKKHSNSNNKINKNNLNNKTSASKDIVFVSPQQPTTAQPPQNQNQKKKKKKKKKKIHPSDCGCFLFSLRVGES